MSCWTAAAGSIESNDYGAVWPNPDNFFLWRKLQTGMYYLKVTGYGSTDEPYVLRIREFTDTTSRGNAATLAIDGSASATIDPEDDEDYFKLELSETTEVAIRASGFPDTVGELQRSNGTVIASNDDGYLPGGRRELSHPGEPKRRGVLRQGQLVQWGLRWAIHSICYGYNRAGQRHRPGPATDSRRYRGREHIPERRRGLLQPDP